ncbi:MAG: GAF domain-containing protein [Aggregatilineaceae bacterium]
MLKSLRARLTFILIVLAVLPTLVAGGAATWRGFSAQRQSAQDLQAEVARRVAGDVEQFLTENTRTLDQALQNAVRAASSWDPNTTPYNPEETALTQLFASNRGLSELALLDQGGQELFHLARRRVISPNDLANRADDDLFRVPVSQQQVYYGAVRFEETTGEPLIDIAIPYLDLRSGVVTQVMVATLQLTPVWDAVAAAVVSEGQEVFVVDSQNRVVAHGNPSVVLSGTTYQVPDSFGEHTGLGGQQVVLAYQKIQLQAQTFSVVAQVPTSVAYRAAYDALTTTVLVVVAAAILATIVGLVGLTRLTRPLTSLAAAARALGAGDLSARAPETGGTEIRTVARALNDTAARLATLIGSLEAMVDARTRDLRLAARVAQQAAAILNPDELLPQIVELTKQSFDLYHAHIYLLNDTQDRLVLAAGAGEVGRAMLARGHNIPVNASSLVARAAREQRPVIVADTARDPNFLANPLLPNTRSEAAFPLVARGRLLGVLDVQSDREDRFGPDLLDVFMTLAGQVAVSLENARLFRETEQASRHEQTLNAITQEIQRATSLDEVIATAARALGKALRAPHTAIELRLASSPQDVDELVEHPQDAMLAK